MIEAILLGALFALLIVKEWQIAQNERRWTQERADLLQRVQAPEQAIVQHAAKETELTLPVPFDDDEQAFLAKEQSNNGRQP